MLKSSYEVEIIVNGKPVKEYHHNGKVYIEGKKGTRFSIKMKNNSFGRKLFVPTIDGLSVMNGEEGSYKSGGYIVQGYSSITIDGWRTSEKEVAEFFFSSPEGSYRKKMDMGNNLGVIGIAVFDEVYHAPQYSYTYVAPGSTVPLPYTYPFTGDVTSGISMKASNEFDASASNKMLCQNSNTLNQAFNLHAGSAPTQKIGTGFGCQKRSEVTTVAFERENCPLTVFEINYNTREELEKEGICFHKEPLYASPQAFPGQFCKPPKCRCGCTNPNCKICN